MEKSTRWAGWGNGGIIILLLSACVLVGMIMIRQADEQRRLSEKIERQNEDIIRQNGQQLEYWAGQSQWNEDFRDWLSGKKRPSATFR